MSAFWTRGRDRSAESENATATGARARTWRLTAVDRCDRCGAQAYVRVLLPSHLELLFCAHHSRQYSQALADIAVEIEDETMRLACCALAGIAVVPVPGCRIAHPAGGGGCRPGGRLGLQALVDFLKLAVKRCLALEVLTM